MATLAADRATIAGGAATQQQAAIGNVHLRTVVDVLTNLQQQADAGLSPAERVELAAAERVLRSRRVMEYFHNPGFHERLRSTLQAAREYEEGDSNLPSPSSSAASSPSSLSTRPVFAEADVDAFLRKTVVPHFVQCVREGGRLAPAGTGTRSSSSGGNAFVGTSGGGGGGSGGDGGGGAGPPYAAASKGIAALAQSAVALAQLKEELPMLVANAVNGWWDVLRDRLKMVLDAASQDVAKQVRAAWVMLRLQRRTAGGCYTKPGDFVTGMICTDHARWRLLARLCAVAVPAVCRCNCRFDCLADANAISMRRRRAAPGWTRSPT
jgi:hypothetical protein